MPNQAPKQHEPCQEGKGISQYHPLLFYLHPTSQYSTTPQGGRGHPGGYWLKQISGHLQGLLWITGL